MTEIISTPIDQSKIYHLLQKIAQQNIIELKNVSIKNEAGYEIIQINHENLYHNYHEILNEKKRDDDDDDFGVDSMTDEHEPPEKKQKENSNISDTSDIMSLLSLPSAKEKQHKQVGEEILELLSKPTAKELQLTEKFRSQGGTQVMEFCPHGTRVECLKAQQLAEENHITDSPSPPEEKVDGENSNDIKPMTLKCNKLHFKKIIQAHTDLVLGDCSFLNTCFHMSTCKYVHYQVDNEQILVKPSKIDQIESGSETTPPIVPKRTIEQPSGLSLISPQWIQCDLRYLDMSCLGKFAVVMAGNLNFFFLQQQKMKNVLWF